MTALMCFCDTSASLQSQIWLNWALWILTGSKPCSYDRGSSASVDDTLTIWEVGRGMIIQGILMGIICWVRWSGSWYMKWNTLASPWGRDKLKGNRLFRKGSESTFLTSWICKCGTRSHLKIPEYGRQSIQRLLWSQLNNDSVHKREYWVRPWWEDVWTSQL